MRHPVVMDYVAIKTGAVVFWSCVLAWLVVFGGVGIWIGNQKGRRAAGWWLGVLLGPIGWIIASLLAPTPAAQLRRDDAVAYAKGEPTSYDRDYEGELRQWAIRTAVARDPSLSGNDSETLARLNVETEKLIAEVKLQRERDAAMNSRPEDD